MCCSLSTHKLRHAFRIWSTEQMLGVSTVEKFSYVIERLTTTTHGGCSSCEGLYNQQWISVFTINELQFPECWYPESWKGLEWHLLNPGAQILAAAQSSKLYSGVKHHNKRSLSGWWWSLGECRNQTLWLNICSLIQRSCTTDLDISLWWYYYATDTKTEESGNIESSISWHSCWSVMVSEDFRLPQWDAR